MSEETGSRQPQDIPPSFAPSSGNRKNGSGQVHSSKPTNTGVTPPSFAPTTSRSRSSVPTSRAHGISSDRPSGRVAGVSSQETPVSFLPPAARSAAIRRSLGSTSTSSHRPMNAAQATQVSAKPSLVSRPTATTAYRRTTSKARKAFHAAIATLLVLVIVLTVALFGAWNWVDGHLNKTPWLSDMNNSSATSWLILGSDERDGADASDITGFRTDTILVLTKPMSGPSSLISIPRDSLVVIDDQYMKINAVAELYDRQTLVEQVEQITGHKIDHVAQLQFGGLINVVDALGGVELCYDQDVDDAYSGLQWTAGCHVSDGNTALAFARMRYSDAQSDFGRAERQRQVIGAIVKKGMSKEILGNFTTVRNVAQAGLDALTVDENTNPYTLAQMVLAFKDASSDEGISGTVYWQDPAYYVDGVGSSVLLDDERNLQLFDELNDGSHEPGAVGTLSEG